VTALTLSTSTAAALRADAVVIGVAKGAKGSGPQPATGAEAARALADAYDGGLAATLETLGATGAEGEVVKLPAPAGVKAPLVVAVGLGDAPANGAEGFAPEALRRAAGAAARALAGVRKAGFALPVPDAAAAAAVGEGALLGAYAFTTYRNGKAAKDGKGAKNAKGGKAGGPLGEAVLLGGKPRDKALKAAVERASVLAAEVNRARDLINTPSNDLTPKTFAATVQAAAKEYGLKFEVLDEKALV
jgi:leucyl aminopeptidase